MLIFFAEGDVFSMSSTDMYPRYIYISVYRNVLSPKSEYRKIRGTQTRDESIFLNLKPVRVVVLVRLDDPVFSGMLE